MRVLISPEFHKRVLICRSSGMKIFDKANISSTIPFAGVLLLNDVKVNNFFREMENPAHNAWDIDRHSNPKLAKKYKTELFRFIKETVLSFAKINTTDEIDADGVGDFLPDELYIELDKNNADKTESITDKTVDIDIKVVDKLKSNKNVKGIQKSNFLSEIDDLGNLSNGENEDSTFNKHTGKTNTTDDGKSLKEGALSDANGLLKSKKLVEVSLMKTRLINLNGKNLYKLIMTPQKSAESAYVTIKLSGEQSTVEAKIRSAYLNDNNNHLLKCFNGKIFLGEIKENEKLSINFLLNYDVNCSMEVTLYGYSV